MNLALTRLGEERKLWRKDHPYGFFARPKKNADGSMNLKHWECGIPGKTNSDWQGGIYRLLLIFPDDYPTSPPKCQFVPAIFHPNVYPSGTVCLSILNAHQDWKPAINVKQILIGVQTLLDEPNLNSPANGDASNLFRRSKAQYKERIKAQARTFSAN